MSVSTTSLPKMSQEEEKELKSLFERNCSISANKRINNISKKGINHNDHWKIKPKIFKKKHSKKSNVAKSGSTTYKNVIFDSDDEDVPCIIYKRKSPKAMQETQSDDEESEEGTVIDEREEHNKTEESEESEGRESIEERSEDDSSEGSLRDFIVKEKKEGSDTEEEVSDSEDSLKEDMNDLTAGINRSNIVITKRVRKKVERYVPPDLEKIYFQDVDVKEFLETEDRDEKVVQEIEKELQEEDENFSFHDSGQEYYSTGSSEECYDCDSF